jgi:serine O-acetyltransferase
VFENLRADIHEARRINVGPDWWNQHVLVLTQPGTLAVISYRFRHWTLGVRVPVLGQLLRAFGRIGGYWIQVMSGVDIQPTAEIGPGFVVHTAHGVLVAAAKIGRNCIVQHGVALTYGSGTIGDNVYFGPGAKVIGHANIGNNVVVVANSLVMTDVADNKTVLGVPARIQLPRGTDDGGRSITSRKHGLEKFGDPAANAAAFEVGRGEGKNA